MLQRNFIMRLWQRIFGSKLLRKISIPQQQTKTITPKQIINIMCVISMFAECRTECFTRSTDDQQLHDDKLWLHLCLARCHKIELKILQAKPYCMFIYILYGKSFCLSDSWSLSSFTIYYLLQAQIWAWILHHYSPQRANWDILFCHFDN